MSPSTRPTHLKTTFLQDAAKSIATTSPSTASYLASESIELELADGPGNIALTDNQRLTFCTACGNVFIPGQNCSIVRGDKDFATQALKNDQRRTVVYYCEACHHRTTFPLPSWKRLDSRNRENSVSRSTNSNVDVKHQVSSDPTIAPAKTSSKKRAKVRKERAGLQSLLKKSKEGTRASPPLSLMDLMMP